MKRLFLLRHAKSSWELEHHGEALRDFDRPLNKRGRDAAAAIGEYCAKKSVQPDVIFCSSAARTRETLERIEGFFSRRPPIIFKDVLYLASADRLLQEIAAAPDRDETLMVIGHNSGIADIAMFLANEETSEAGALQTLHRKYPTGALAEFRLNINQWADLTIKSVHGAGTLKRFITPKALMAT